MFRIPVNLNQTVDNVKVEDQKNVNAESSESDGKANERCLHVVLNDQRVGPVEWEPVIDEKLSALNHSDNSCDTDSKAKTVESEACESGCKDKVTSVKHY